jgi:hypothetical protein
MAGGAEAVEARVEVADFAAEGEIPAVRLPENASEADTGGRDWSDRRR